MSWYVCVFYTSLYFFIKIIAKYLLMILQIQFPLLFMNTYKMNIIYVAV